TTPFPCHSMTLPSPALRILEHLRLVPERTQSGLRKRKRPGYLTGRPGDENSQICRAFSLAEAR
ncbi:MAG TPA: hypothetical protein VIM33_02805, partial [Gaiellaceae bacterium]